MADTTVAPPRLALFLSGLGLGGVQRSMLTLAGVLAENYQVDLVVPTAAGPFRDRVPETVRLVELAPWWIRLPVIRDRKRRRVLASIPAMAGYLRRAKPDVVLTASHYVNIAAVCAHVLARSPARLVVSQRTHLSTAITNSRLPIIRRRPALGWLVRKTYPLADAIVSVSDGVADDLAAVGRLPRERIRTIYNPVVTPELERGCKEQPDHPWFRPDGPPVILAVGRLAAQKDFGTLIDAFAVVYDQRPALRLVILGEGRLRAELESRVRDRGLDQVVDLPGYAENPFAYMARASLFVLSSRYEGLPGALVQAVACGCPAVSTDCPSGPREILDHGRLGPLVPVGDSRALARAILQTLEHPAARHDLLERARVFSAAQCAADYLQVLRDGGGARN